MNGVNCVTLHVVVSNSRLLSRCCHLAPKTVTYVKIIKCQSLDRLGEKW